MRYQLFWQKTHDVESRIHVATSPEIDVPEVYQEWVKSTIKSKQSTRPEGYGLIVCDATSQYFDKERL